MESTLAVILAGGRGKRMGILCQHRAKPALPFAGNIRVIDFTLSNCTYSQIENIAVLIDYQRSSLASYIGQWSSVNYKSRNIRIETAKRPHLGSADAVYQSLDYLENNGSDLVLVLAGDHIYRMDYGRLLDFHRRMGADVTVGVVPVPIEEAHRFGIVTTDKDERIIDFVEKPELPQSDLVSMGIYVFNKQLLIERLIEDAELTNSPHDFGHAVLPGIVSRDNVFAYRFDGYWRDIGNPQAYYEANMELLLPKPSFSLDGKRPVLTESNHLSTYEESQKGSIENSLVSPGCNIKGRVENSILSPGVWVGEEAVVRDSVIMKDTFIDYHSIIDHCVLDEKVNVGKYCYLGIGGTVTSGKRSITVVGEGVTVPSHTAVGRNCKVQPHVGPSDFGGKVVSSNSILSPRRFVESLQTEGKEVLANVGQGIRTP